jgi:hypothetical protein
MRQAHPTPTSRVSRRTGTLVLMRACGTLAIVATSCTSGAGGPEQSPTKWSDDITASTNWSETMCPIVVDKPIRVGGGNGEAITLKIDAGCEIRFEADGGIGVDMNGAIEAIGTDESPITMRPVHDAEHWEGLGFSTSDDSPLSTLDHVVIRRAGVQIFGGHPLVRHITVRDSLVDGISLARTSGAGFAVGSMAITSTMNGGAGLALDFDDLDEIPDGCDFSANGIGGVFARLDDDLESKVLDHSLTLHGIDATYVVPKPIEISGSPAPMLTLEAGATIETPFIVVGGTAPGGLRALGSAERPAGFKGTGPTPFGGLRLTSLTTETVLVHTNIVDADVGMFIWNATATLQHVHIEASNTGISIGQVNTSGELTADSTAVEIEALYPVVTRVDAVTTLPAVDSSYVGDQILVVGGDAIRRSGTWHAFGGIVYGMSQTSILVGSSSGDPVTLTIEPGTRIGFAGGVGQVSVGPGADLIARGTAADPIVFTGPAPGSWSGIGFGNPTSASILDHVIVENAGGFSSNGAIAMRAPYPIIQNSTVTGSASCGIYVVCDSQSGPPSISNITYSGNQAGDLCAVGCPAQ